MNYDYITIIQNIESCKLDLDILNYFLERGHPIKKGKEERELYVTKLDFYIKMLKCYTFLAVDNLEDEAIKEYKNHLVEKYNIHKKSLEHDFEITKESKKTKYKEDLIYNSYLDELEENELKITSKYIEIYNERIKKVYDMTNLEIIDIIKKSLDLDNIEQEAIQFNEKIQTFYLNLCKTDNYNRIISLLKMNKKYKENKINFNFSYDTNNRQKYLYSRLPSKKIWDIEKAYKDLELITRILDHDNYDEIHKKVEKVLYLSSTCAYQKKKRKNKAEYVENYEQLQSIINSSSFRIYDSLKTAVNKKNYKLVMSLIKEIDNYNHDFYIYTSNLKEELENCIKFYEIEKEKNDLNKKDVKNQLMMEQSKVDPDKIIPENIFISILEDSFKNNVDGKTINNYYFQPRIGVREVIGFNKTVDVAESMKKLKVKKPLDWI